MDKQTVPPGLPVPAKPHDVIRPGATPRGRAPDGLQDMSAAYFGLVMATGIVSLACAMMGLPMLGLILFYLNIVQYVVLCVLYALRAWRYPRRFFGDMVAHETGPGYFTMVAGTGVLASQFMLLWDDFGVGMALWVLTLILWAGLVYAIFTALTVRPDKPELDRGINGGWLLAVVATQSVAVSSALLATQIDGPFREELNLLALSTWLWGGMLYIWLMALIFYRYTFFRLSSEDLTPPYWINMGAMAISTLAGSLLIQNAPQAPYLVSLLPFLKGFTLLYWATGTWWIPLLLLLGFWRYVYQRYPIEYDPLYWGAVFPLGMYAACTWQMTRAMRLDFLDGVPQLFLYAALLAWVVTFVGLLLKLRHRLGLKYL
ncbi:MAG: tellurite resistance/C4-dicarboxylate transporter family protein [Alcaligenaceae bacterium]|nr:tellurite resistance/C4-dicarboxylate transporter family protein [Alcaligenaceae bacterium]